jgi:hypothetical protein
VAQAAPLRRPCGAVRRVDDLDLLARRERPGPVRRSLEQPADDLAHAAELVGELLVGGTCSTPALAEQQRGEALVELAEGDLLDELHQVGDALGKQVEDEIAEGALAQQGRRTPAFGGSISRVSDSVTPRAL